jgi:hypothetical protein
MNYFTMKNQERLCFGLYNFIATFIIKFYIDVMSYEERKGKKRKENQLCFLICLIAFHFSCAFSPVDGNDSWEA